METGHKKIHFEKISCRGQPPTERIAHSLEIIDNKAYVFGGYSGLELDDFFTLDLKTFEWKRIEVNYNRPRRRNNHASAVFQQTLFIHGGYDGEDWLNDMFCFNTVKESWTELYFTDHQLKPSKRACHTMTCIDEKIYLFGGYDGEKHFSQIEIFDIATKKWLSPITSEPGPIPRHQHSMNVWGKYLVLFAGVGCLDPQNPHFLDDLWLFDTETLQWQQIFIRGIPPMGLKNHTGNIIGDQLFIIGGYGPIGGQNELSHELRICDLKQKKWLDDSAERIMPLMTHKTVTFQNDKILLFGGFTKPNKWLSDVYILGYQSFDVSQIKSPITDEMKVSKFMRRVSNSGKKKRFPKLFSSQIYKILTKKCPDVGIIRPAKEMVSNILDSVFLKLLEESKERLENSKSKKLEVTIIQNEVSKLFPGELSKKANNFAQSYLKTKKTTKKVHT